MNHINRLFPYLFLFAFVSFSITSCSSSGDDIIEVIGDDGGDEGAPEGSLATSGCQNVVIASGFAYAACGEEIEVVSLTSLDRNLLNISADDITVDEDSRLLFVQDTNTIRMLSLDDPMIPSVIATANTNFSAFSGISATNGILVVSAGAGSANTQVYTYTDTALTLATNGNATIDNVTGNPDVNIIATADGVTAFYSQDIGAVANWAIQIADIDTDGQITNTPPSIVLTPGQFTGGPFSPANFPVESEFLDDILYVAHFAVQGIEVIDLSDNSLQTPIPLPYEPTNIATDGLLLFVVGASNDAVDVIDPSTGVISESLNADSPLSEPTGVAASLTHVAIADRNDGLIVIERQ